jgi:hypothetical protein
VAIVRLPAAKGRHLRRAIPGEESQLKQGKDGAEARNGTSARQIDPFWNTWGWFFKGGKA